MESERYTAVPVASAARKNLATLDLVIPIFDEAPVLPALLEALNNTFTLGACAELGIASVNCLFVDDGSRDFSAAIIQRQPPTHLGIRILRLSRNFGHQAAVSAGLANSSADLIAVMDADLQDPPECIPRMIERIRDGFEVVYGRRATRQEGLLKRFFYASFYRMFRLMSPISVPVDAGDFCLLTRRIVDELNRLPESLRFPRGLRAWVGFPQIAIEYDRPARAAGQSSYGWRELYNLATEGIASMSLRPLKLAQVLALLYLLLSVGGVAALLLGAFDQTDLNTQLNLLTILMVGSNSFVLFCLYILGAYLGRAYVEVKGRPCYIVYEDLVMRKPAVAEANQRRQPDSHRGDPR